MLLKVVKILISQLIPYYTTTITIVGGFFVGYETGIITGIHPIITGIAGIVIPFAWMTHLLPVYFERDEKFKLVLRSFFESDYQKEVVKDIIDKSRKIEKEMGVNDVVSYVVTDKKNMGVMKFNDKYIILIPKIFIDNLLNSTYVFVAHELAHIKNHHLEKMRIAYTLSLLSSAVINFVSTLHSIKLGLASLLISPLAFNFAFMRYISKLEDEADQESVKYVNPQEFTDAIKSIVESIEYYKMLEQAYEKHSLLFSMLNPHRPLNERIEKIRI